jgi:hypothetical protein
LKLTNDKGAKLLAAVDAATSKRKAQYWSLVAEELRERGIDVPAKLAKKAYTQMQRNGFEALTGVKVEKVRKGRNGKFDAVRWPSGEVLYWVRSRRG